MRSASTLAPAHKQEVEGTVEADEAGGHRTGVERKAAGGGTGSVVSGLSTLSELVQWVKRFT